MKGKDSILSGPLGDIVSTDKVQQPLRSLQWEEARLSCSRDEFAGRLQAAEKRSPDLIEQLEIYNRGHEGKGDFTGVIRFNDWLLQQMVTGPYIRIPLLQLLYKEMSALNNMTMDETSRSISALVERVSRITISNHKKQRITTLGDLLPQEYILRTGSSGQALRLRDAPGWSLDRTPLSQLVGDWGDGKIGEEVCSPCRRDPESALGGGQWCGVPGGILRYKECKWPPPEPLPIQYEYTIHVGNSWWTTLIGVWHGSAYTRTTRTWQNTTLPWIVPEIEASVGPTWGNISHVDSRCVFWGNERTMKFAESYNDDEVSVGWTSLAFIEPWGIVSGHHGGNRWADYNCGKWHWNSIYP